jgi:cation diffusion facilitator family transporter
MSSSESRVLVLLALVANAGIAVLKFVAAFVSGSTTMLAEGFHSVADTGNQLFLLRGEKQSRRQASARYPFGQGKEAFFWAFMVAVFLFVGGGVVAIVEGLDRLRHPHEPEGGLVFNLVVLGIAAAFELGVAFRPALKEFNRRRGSQTPWRAIRETKDPTLLVVLFEDSVAVLGILIAAGGLLVAHFTGNPTWDGITSIVIGAMLCVTAWILAIETKGLLVGEAAGEDTQATIRKAVLSVEGVETVERLLTMQLGPNEILVNVDVTVGTVSGAELEECTRRIEAAVTALVPQATRLFVEYGREL